ncbi:hypothetical protein MHBO_001879 [Bonamia ostreae]|uniref:Ribosomal protein L11 n=1 Tax=Bonamia ostreae TaxID=126728 RepID=A0ABV2AKI5_9EUKA
MATFKIPKMSFARKAGERTLKTKLRLRCSAAIQRPGPKLGKSLGNYGINMMQFCKKYNELTKNLKDGVETPVLLYVYKNKTFEMEIRYPSASWFLMKAANIEKGSEFPLREKVGRVSLRQIYEIARIKQCDPGKDIAPLKGICKSLIGSARSLGIDVVD